MKLTYKEQAEELIQDFYSNKLDQYNTFGKYNYSFAVDCAILTVTKIIISLRKTIPEVGLGKGYWYSVREELLNLENDNKEN